MRFQTIYIVLFIVLSICIVSCKKLQAKKLAGIYDCTGSYHYWDISPTTIDSTYDEMIEVKRDGENIVVFERTIHIDELQKEKKYAEGANQSAFSIQFKDEKIHATLQDGGLGGGSTRTYVGEKLE